MHFQTLLDSGSEEEFNKNFELFKLRMEFEADKAPLMYNQYLKRGERGKTYIMFAEISLYNQTVREIKYGTFTSAYVMSWYSKVRNHRSSNMCEQVLEYDAKDKVVYVIPNSLKQSYKKAIKNTNI